MFTADDDTSTLPVAPSDLAGTDFLVVNYFTVGFKPQGGQTSLYRGPADFVFEQARRAQEEVKRRAQRERSRGAVALLKSWLSADKQNEAEYRETLEYLVKALDEDRPSYRKLFP